MKKIIKVFSILLALLIAGLSAFVAWSLYPHENRLPLPNSLISHNSTAGAERLRSATSKTDYGPLSEWYQAQNLVSYCGVASSVTVLGALGINTTQSEFFTDKATQVRGRMNVIFGGMSLADLSGLLGAHGLKTSPHHADDFDAAHFRETLEKNLASADDYLIVNYQRKILGQSKGGHISPVAAYDRATDSVLIMDSAAHKYPPTWAPLNLVYSAMKTIDTASGTMRGYVEVSK